MKRLTSALILMGALGLGVAVPATSFAAPPGDSGQYQNQNQARYRGRLSDRQVQNLLARIRTDAQLLLRNLEGTPQYGRIYGNRTTGDVAYLVDDLITAANHLDDHITRAVTTRTDVDDILRRAAAIDAAFTRTSPNRAAQTSWDTVRRDVDSLANAYGLTWDWRNPSYDNQPPTGLYTRYEGTYTLEPGRSDNAQRAIDQALRGVSAANRDRVSRQLQNRLDPPQMIAIDRNGGKIIVASTNGPQFTFDADGQARTEAGPGGNQITTRASLYGDQLDVTTTGMANNEFGVVFEPLRGGEELRVTRRVYIDALTRPISLQSIYRRTSTTPDWNLYNRPNNNRPGDYRPGDTRPGAMLVPDGTVLTARLDQSVNVRDARDEDRISLTVYGSSRPELEGATIEGNVISRGSVVGDRVRMSIQFDRIRLRNGRSGDFDGVIERIASPNGQVIQFNGETASVDRNSGDALQRGAIGAVVGGLIGALAGGGKGAAIGAAIGGGGAAATVLLDNNTGQVELVRGTQFTIRARNR